MTIEIFLAEGKSYQGMPLDSYKVFVKDKVICEYYAVSPGLLSPGIFAINDPLVADANEQENEF